MSQKLKTTYQETIVPKLKEQFGYTNIHQVPKVIKITVNRGLGEASQNAKALESSKEELSTITGQQPVVTRAKKAIAGFKIREGMPVGVMVTLRGDRMYAFLDRLINLALPRIRDFRGISGNSFDGRGNYSLGIREQLIFPEIEYDKIDQIRGMDISIITTAKTDEEGRALLKEMGMPFR
ncbi:MAG: 50S ribosomal protein L5 [Microcystis aeruginosa Ma_QC_Ch_20071001_S25]|jgi:large subunit ribosomal protein L5|uniref:Large ribosomal subunit protein uL5 n=8 Tax=Microcystis TaxID=1125 RepID=I4IMV1_MICAE|nr:MULTISPECIES: 50S ribosomal protein L5 [Microcystis]MCA2817375.1 50S ribosomal protein L5 [Microcystis sp. M085S1]MCA2853935.1 50S ribosomal protein L5 [Microcystis sp. M065S1]MCA2925804.1 50S ribosomal protein L5 [Microcystis sp. M020S1]MCA2937267.1 50S ribosomal protein L5 [Microcystis sp. M015S1]MCU7245740.1 50S ribosomal protein L5 [Microcystis aeruginosa WS75]MDJ0562058.1 50S ribosomal protein L5 [Microcystis sp. M53599_WE4]NCQ84501.1 50S ribosomal protein L5 [Microcystis aeruginosa 